MKANPHLSVFALLAVCANVSAEDVRSGLWKISIESSVPATPDWKPEPYEATQCLTENDARNPDRLLTGMGAQGVVGCDFLNRQYSGGRLTFDVQCSGSLGLTGHGDLGFSATNLDGALEVAFAGMAPGAERTVMQNKLHGVYLGGCPEAAGGGDPAVSGATNPPALPPAPPAE